MRCAGSGPSPPDVSLPAMSADERLLDVPLDDPAGTSAARGRRRPSTWAGAASCSSRRTSDAIPTLAGRRPRRRRRRAGARHRRRARLPRRSSGGCSTATRYESFFVRPHQAGNPDAVQYTPVCNGISSWQLYHGEGFWAPITFPLDAWFTIRVAFAGSRAEVFVGETTSPSLVVRELEAAGRPGADRDPRRRADAPRRPLRLRRRADARPSARRRRSAAAAAGVIAEWQVSDPFPESLLDDATAPARRSSSPGARGRRSPPSRPDSSTSRACTASATAGTPSSPVRRSARSRPARAGSSSASAIAPSST